MSVSVDSTKTGIPSNGTFNTPVLLPNGSVSSPSLAFVNTTTMGLYRKSTTTMAVSAGNQWVAQFSSSSVQVLGSQTNPFIIQGAEDNSSYLQCYRDNSGHGRLENTFASGDFYFRINGTDRISLIASDGSVRCGNYHISPSEYDAGNSSTALTLNLSNGAMQKTTLTGNCTFTLSNPVAGGTYILKLTQDGTGSRTVTWPAAVKWAGGSAPTLTTTASRTDLITLTYDGTYYMGSYALNYNLS